MKRTGLRAAFAPLALSKDQRGQAVTEYILVIAIVTGFYMLLLSTLSRIGLGAALSKPIVSTFASTYQYGFPGAKGFDDGGPTNHPRASSSTGTGNFRIFINPAGS